MAAAGVGAASGDPWCPRGRPLGTACLERVAFFTLADSAFTPAPGPYCVSALFLLIFILVLFRIFSLVRTRVCLFCRLSVLVLLVVLVFFVFLCVCVSLPWFC